MLRWLRELKCRRQSDTVLISVKGLLADTVSHKPVYPQKAGRGSLPPGFLPKM